MNISGSGPKHSTGHQHDPVTTLRRHLSSKRDDSDIRKQDTRSGCLIRVGVKNETLLTIFHFHGLTNSILTEGNLAKCDSNFF